MIKVTVWNENIHEKEMKVVKDIYPLGIHGTIAKFLEKSGNIETKCATLEMEEHGLTNEVLEWTDVLIWWGHAAHHAVSDNIVKRVHDHVLKGMGLIVLHSGHHSKIFKSLMGTTCNLKWREIDENERIWSVMPGHPIASGLGEYFEIEKEEMYGEFFDIPQPDELVFIGWFKGGEVFRSGCCYNRGYGKVFYFQPGHETYPIYHQAEIQKVITNAVYWAKKQNSIQNLICPNIPEPLEKL